MTRTPSLVVARGLRPAALGQSRSARAVRGRRSGQVGPMRLFPGVRPGLILRRRHVHGVMQPAMPTRRHRGRFRDTIVDYPAPFKAKRRIDFATLGPVIAIAEFVLADKRTIEPRPPLRAESLAVPPGEHTQQENFHRWLPVADYCLTTDWRLDAIWLLCCPGSSRMNPAGISNASCCISMSQDISQNLRAKLAELRGALSFAPAW